MLFQDSFNRAKNWVRELQRQGSANIVIALAGNKSDLAAKRKVEPEVSVASKTAGCDSRLEDLGIW